MLLWVLTPFLPHCNFCNYNPPLNTLESLPPPQPLSSPHCYLQQVNYTIARKIRLTTMLQNNRWCFHNFVLLVVGKWIGIGMEASHKEFGNAFRTRLNNIKVIGVGCIGCAVNVRTVGTVINLNRRDINEWMMPWRWRVRVNAPDLSWARKVWQKHRHKHLHNKKRVVVTEKSGVYVIIGALNDGWG